MARSRVCIQLSMSLYCNRTQQEVPTWPLLILWWLQVKRRNIKWRVSWGITGRGEQWNTLYTGVVLMKQKIVGFQSKILSMLTRFYNSTSMLTSFSEIVYKKRLDLPLDFVSFLLLYLIGHYCRVIQNLCNGLYGLYHCLIWYLMLTRWAPFSFSPCAM